MGMPMNSFDMFCALKENLKEGRDDKHSQFVLSAVIVHDNKDKDLINRIENNFIHWAELSGNHFLFITFLTPTGEWRESPYCKDTYWIDKNRLLTDKDLEQEDQEATDELLRNYMGLPSKGSFIMLTERLDSNAFFKIPTSSSAIEQQLDLITKYCNSPEIQSPGLLNELLENLKAVKLNSSTSFIDILVNYTSIISRISPFGRRFGKRMQSKTASRVLNEEKKKLEQLSGDELEEGILKISREIAIAAKNNFESSRRGRHSIRRRLPLVNKLSPYSLKLFQTYQWLERIIESSSVDDFIEIDYSFLTVNLGKIVENELNLSIQQLLRCEMGVEMPEYYNKYCSERGDIMIRAGEVTININKQQRPWDSEDTELRSIPIGNLIYAYESMYFPHDEIFLFHHTKSKHRHIGEGAIKFFRWFGSKFRNKASHIDYNSYETYSEAKEAFSQFVERYLPSLYDIKLFLSQEDPYLSQP